MGQMAMGGKDLTRLMVQISFFFVSSLVNYVASPT